MLFGGKSLTEGKRNVQDNMQDGSQGLEIMRNTIRELSNMYVTKFELVKSNIIHGSDYNTPSSSRNS